MEKISWSFILLFFLGCAHQPAVSTANVSEAEKKSLQESSIVKQSKIKESPTVVKIKIETNQGNILTELYPDKAPKTVENFVKLTNQGFYNGIIFHRVIPDFMIQTGDPTGTGMGGPGYQFQDEFSDLRHDQPGILSMANSGPGTNGSQFFITEVPTPWLDNRHSIFGKVTEGMDVVRNIARVPRDAKDKPLEDVVMKKVTVAG